MKIYRNLYLLVAIILYPIIFYSKYIRLNFLSEILIPFFVTWVLLFVILNTKLNTKKDYWFVGAFVFICFGDYLINLTPYKQFSAVAFGCTHICLSIFYISNTGFKKGSFKWIFVPVVLSIVAIIFTFKDFSEQYLRTIFISYLVILSFMLWRALSYIDSTASLMIKILVVFGSFFFYFTDIFVCMQVLYPQKIFISLTWILYPPALVMLSLLSREQQISNV